MHSIASLLLIKYITLKNHLITSLNIFLFFTLSDLSNLHMSTSSQLLLWNKSDPVISNLHYYNDMRRAIPSTVHVSARHCSLWYRVRSQPEVGTVGEERCWNPHGNDVHFREQKQPCDEMPNTCDNSLLASVWDADPPTPQLHNAKPTEKLPLVLKMNR